MKKAIRSKPKSALDSIRPPLMTIYGLQLGVLVVASGITFPIDRVAAYSLLMGGLISVVPNAYFARQVFRFSGAADAREVARSFYVGESGKFIATLGLFGFSFALVKPLNVFVLFSAYLMVMLMNAVMLAYFSRRQRKASN